MAFGKMHYSFRNLTYIHRSSMKSNTSNLWHSLKQSEMRMRSLMVSDFSCDKLKIRKTLGRNGNHRKGKKITEFHPAHFTTFTTQLLFSVYLLGEACLSSVMPRKVLETVGSSRLWWTPQLMLEQMGQMGCEIVKLKTVRVPRHQLHEHTWRVYNLYNLECVNKLASQGCQLSHYRSHTQAPAAYNTPVPSERLRLPFLTSVCRLDSLSADQETDPKRLSLNLYNRSKDENSLHS